MEISFTSGGFGHTARRIPEELHVWAPQLRCMKRCKLLADHSPGLVQEEHAYLFSNELHRMETFYMLILSFCNQVTPSESMSVP